MKKVILISGKAQTGKDEAAKILNSKLNNSLIVHFGDYVKYICSQYFGWDGKKDEKGRETLQRIGTDVVRKRNPDFWIDIIHNFISVFKYDFDYIIIPDTRFKNEIEKTKLLFPTITLRINGKIRGEITEEQQRHISETELDDYSFDYIIDNSEDGIDKLEKKVDLFIIKTEKEYCDISENILVK